MTDTQRDLLTSSVTVASYELDSFGHVNNAVFLNYLEKARCDYMRLKGLKFEDFSQWDRYPLVVRVSLEYKYPAKTDDILDIDGWISRHTATSFTMQYEVTNRENQRVVLTGETVHVFVDGNNRPARMPELFKKNFLELPGT
jgi:acyl-CoA thioester hydrolase